MLLTRDSFLAAPLLCALVLPAASVTARAQGTSSADAKLALKAALVLTPDFCATRMNEGFVTSQVQPLPHSIHETYEVGKAACAELEPALKGVFLSLIRVAAPPPPEEAQVVLLPRFVGASTTRPEFAYSKRKMIVFLEWTVKDKSGRTIWIETVQGSAEHNLGTAFTIDKNLKLIVKDSVRDAAEQSASKMSSAQELRKVATGLTVPALAQ